MNRFPAWQSTVGAGLLACIACGSDPAAPAPAGSAPQDPNALFNTSTPGGGPCAPSPQNFEVPGNGCDDDADGTADNLPACDDNLPPDGSGAHFARALGICQMADAKRWGLVSADYTNSFGSTAPPNPSQHGILPKFGSSLKPRQGAALGVLSSGLAREFNGGSGLFKQGQRMGGPGRVPPGFPKPAAGCPIDSTVYDVISVKLKIKAPANARGVAFDFNFASGEWPEWVCTRYNDGFVAMLASKATGGQATNISYDAQNNAVSVNNAFFDRCTPGTTTGCRGEPPIFKVAACTGGESELAGTGFEPRNNYCGNKTSTGGGATGWLSSQAAVEPGEEITVEFFIWDTGDDDFDSSVLLDNVRWEAGPTQTQTARPK